MDESAGDPRPAVHEALHSFLKQDEILVGWTVILEVANVTSQVRYLAHRSGGGANGTDDVMVWTEIGMLESVLANRRRDVVNWTTPTDDGNDS